jgi:tRNA 2-thiouridine synthesizing protein A
MTQAKADLVIDGRDMEPPEPFVQTMEALDSIKQKPGQKVLLVLAREPFPLYRALQLNGVAWLTERTADGAFAILMWHTTDGCGESAFTPGSMIPPCGPQ